MSKIPGQVPQYKKLYEKLRKQILRGVYSPGTILPSESELFEKYKVTQPVIRQALAMLVSEGLIKKHQGKGSIVQARPVGVGIISLQGKDVTSHNNIAKIKTRLLHGPKIISWPSDLFIQPSQLELKQKCLFIERMRSVNNEIVFIEKFYIPADLLPGIHRHSLDNTSFYNLLAKKYQITILSSEQKFIAIAADQQISSLLKIKKGNPLIRLERRMETNKTGYAMYSSLIAVTNNYLLYSQS